MQETFLEAFARLIKASGVSQKEIIRRTNDQITLASTEIRYAALARMISPVSQAMLSMALRGERNLSAQELRKICYFGLALSSEQCDQLEALRKRDRITQGNLPAMPKTDTAIPQREYALPAWLCAEKQ